MAAPPDRDYMAACSRLASLMSISISAARRRVDLAAVKEGIRDTPGRIALAERLLIEAEPGSQAARLRLDGLLEAVASEANFMDED